MVFEINLGNIYCVKEDGNIVECADLGQCILFLFYYSDRQSLLAVTEDGTLVQHAVSVENTIIETSRVIKICKVYVSKVILCLLKAKLNVKAEKLQAVLCPNGLLIMAYGEPHVKLYDLSNDENASLTLSTEKGFSRSDSINCIAYSSKQGS